MATIIPRFDHGPVTFTAIAAVVGGQLVDGVAGGVQPSAATSNVCVGVATTDALPVATSQAPTIPGITTAVNAAPLPPYVAVAAEGVWPLTYAAAATFGARLVTAANGQVTPAGATPDARQVVGICLEPAGVGIGAVGATQLMLS
jgi:hypothetical protein